MYQAKIKVIGYAEIRYFMLEDPVCLEFTRPITEQAQEAGMTVPDFLSKCTTMKMEGEQLWEKEPVKTVIKFFADHELLSQTMQNT